MTDFISALLEREAIEVANQHWIPGAGRSAEPNHRLEGEVWHPEESRIRLQLRLFERAATDDVGRLMAGDNMSLEIATLPTSLRPLRMTLMDEVWWATRRSRIRTRPGSPERVGVLQSGEEVFVVARVTDREGTDWLQIEIDDRKVGYVLASSLSPALDPDEEEMSLNLTAEQRIRVRWGLGEPVSDGTGGREFDEEFRLKMKDWQRKRGETATGFLTREQSEALQMLGRNAERKADEMRRAAERIEAEERRQKEEAWRRERERLAALERRRRAEEEAERRVREPHAAPMKHKGVTVNILTRPGPVIAGRLEERGEEFEEMTGATIKIATISFADLFRKLMMDWSTGTNSIDAAVLPHGWAVELADWGLLSDLSNFVANDHSLELDDIAPYFRKFSQKVDGKTYLITVDGDFHMMYYRTDVLEKYGLDPPDTWDEYLKVAAKVHGHDMNGDGEPDYGSCLFKKRNAQGFWLILSVAGAFLQSRGTGQGIFFETETMEPLVRNEGFAEALRILKATGQYGPPDELNLDLTGTRQIVLSGRCALFLEWGDIGPLSIDLTQSRIDGLVASKILPGSRQVLDRSTGKLVNCTPEICPHAIDGVNYTPFAAFGGWAGAVNAGSDRKVIAAAYDFFSYMNSPGQSNFDVTQGWTGYNPYRISQFEQVLPWVNAGYSRESAHGYLAGIAQSLNSPNMASDLRIPGTYQYEGICLDREVARFLADEITAEETMDNIYECWEEVTEDFGRKRQAELYRASLGITN